MTTPASFRERAHAFQQSRVLLTAYELGVFTALGDEARTSNEVAHALGIDAHAADRLMNALVALQLLEKRGDRFANGAFAARHLVSGTPEYLSGLMHSVHLWTTWSTLTEAVRAGHAVAPRREGGSEDRWREAFIAAMHWRGAQQAPDVIALIDLDGVARVLDLGGGSGAYAMAFARARRELRAVVFDLPEVTPLTRRYVRDAGLSDRVSTVDGDLLTDDFGEGFDLVFISAIVHIFPPEANRRLVARAARALSPRGRVAVQDFLMDEDRAGPLSSALFALNMLVGTEAGDTYTESEIRAWMRDAGLSGVTRRDTPFGASVVIGRLGG